MPVDNLKVKDELKHNATLGRLMPRFLQLVLAGGGFSIDANYFQLVHQDKDNFKAALGGSSPHGPDADLLEA